MLRLVAGATLLLALVHTTAATVTSIKSGEAWYDTDGKEIHAHGGGILKYNGLYLWYGTSVKLPPSWLSTAVTLYSSSDLLNWDNKGSVLLNTSIHTDIPAPLRIERPKVIFNSGTGKYVMYFHLDSASFGFEQVGVATADSPYGPFTFVAGFQPDGLASYDMGLYQEPATEEGQAAPAYLVRSVENKYAGVSKLTDDYLNTTGIISKGPRVEGQAIWRANGIHYLIGSHLTGWKANAAVLSKGGASLSDAWTALGNPTGDATTFNSQSTFVLDYHRPDGSSYFVFMADRWNYGGPGSVGNASYVWLPMLPSPGSATGWNITWRPSWQPETCC